MSNAPATDRSENNPKRDMPTNSETAKALSGSMHTAGSALEVRVKGTDGQEAWSNLLDLVAYAIECKNAQGGLWPHMVMTDAGKITVKTQNEEGALSTTKTIQSATAVYRKRGALELARDSVDNEMRNGRTCPDDTDGDGDCGRPSCPVCGTMRQNAPVHRPEHEQPKT